MDKVNLEIHYNLKVLDIKDFKYNFDFISHVILNEAKCSQMNMYHEYEKLR
jgi:hypothetical protein